MSRRYSNENFPLPAVVELRRLGHDCETVAESGNSNIQMTDAEVVRYATSTQRAVITLNRRHFVALHEKSENHAGIVVCTVDADFIALAGRIHEAIAKIGSLDGRLIRILRQT